MISLFFDPFLYDSVMRKALASCFSLSIGSAPLGVFLLFRRMSLIGDALSHAILPGIAVGYVFSKTSFLIMSIGGFFSGLTIVVLSSWISTISSLKEDAIFSGLYLFFLSSGIVLISINGSDIDLLHLLFGSILSLNSGSIYFISIISSVTFLILSLLYRAFVIELFDSTFLRINCGKLKICLLNMLFMLLVVLNLIAGFQVLGTIMSIGLMVLPAITIRCWTNNLTNMLLFSIVISAFSSWIGLLISFYLSIPAGPSIILFSSLIFFISIIIKRNHFF